MSEEQLRAFLEKVKGDTSLQEKLKATTTSEAAVEIAKEEGFAMTAEDIQSMQSQSRELTDEVLEGATGGLVDVTLASPTPITRPGSPFEPRTPRRAPVTHSRPTGPTAAPAPIIK